jgi:hypothetical protein
MMSPRENIKMDHKMVVKTMDRNKQSTDHEQTCDWFEEDSSDDEQMCDWYEEDSSDDDDSSYGSVPPLMGRDSSDDDDDSFYDSLPPLMHKPEPDTDSDDDSDDGIPWYDYSAFGYSQGYRPGYDSDCPPTVAQVCPSTVTATVVAKDIGGKPRGA